MKPVNEFVKTHLLAISLGFMSQTSFILVRRKPYVRMVEKVSRYLKMHLYVLEYILVSQPNIQHEEMYLMSSDTNSLAHKMEVSHSLAPKYRRQVIYGKIKRDIGVILRQLCERKGVEIIEAEACKDHIHVS